MATYIKPENYPLKEIPAEMQGNREPEAFCINVWQTKKNAGKYNIAKANPRKVGIKNMKKREKYR